MDKKGALISGHGGVWHPMANRAQPDYIHRGRNQGAAGARGGQKTCPFPPMMEAVR